MSRKKKKLEQTENQEAVVLSPEETTQNISEDATISKEQTELAQEEALFDAGLQTELSKTALIEGILFATGTPISVSQLCELLQMEEEEVKNALGELQTEYAGEKRGFWLVRVAGGYQLRTKPKLKQIMAQFYEKKPPRLSQPMLEVLSIVAYKQPVTRPLIDKIRGVDSTAPLKTLLDRGLVEMKGRSESVGNPVLYGTTQKFLEWFQIESLSALPPLSEIEILRQASSGPEGEELLEMLTRDDGFVSEDLRELDTTLLDVARQQRKFEEGLTPAENAASTEAVEAPAVESTSTGEMAHSPNNG